MSKPVHGDESIDQQVDQALDLVENVFTANTFKNMNHKQTRRAALLFKEKAARADYTDSIRQEQSLSK